MIRILATIAALGFVGHFAGPAMAEDKQDAVFIGEVGDVSPSLAKKEAQCAHRRIMPPDSHDNCANGERSNAQIGCGQDGAAAQAAIGPGNGGGQGNGIGPGSGGGRGNGIGPGSGGGGQGKGSR